MDFQSFDKSSYSWQLRQHLWWRCGELSIGFVHFQKYLYNYCSHDIFKEQVGEIGSFDRKWKIVKFYVPDQWRVLHNQGRGKGVCLMGGGGGGGQNVSLLLREPKNCAPTLKKSLSGGGGGGGGGGEGTATHFFSDFQNISKNKS